MTPTQSVILRLKVLLKVTNILLILLYTWLCVFLEINSLRIILDFAAPADFFDQSGTVELTPASTKQCISIPIIDDSVSEVDQECFTISLSESSGTADLTLSPAIATVCIIDTDGKFRGIHVQVTSNIK